MNGLKLSKFIVLPLFIFLFLATAIFLFLPGNREYTKINIVYYNLYTFDEVKNVPMLSDVYQITYDPVDGNSSEFNDIIFFNVNADENKKLFEYVESIGFSKQFDTDKMKERWVKDNIIINIIINESEKTTSFFVEKD